MIDVYAPKRILAIFVSTIPSLDPVFRWWFTSVYCSRIAKRLIEILPCVGYPSYETWWRPCPIRSRSVTWSCLIHDFSYALLLAHACPGTLFLVVLCRFTHAWSRPVSLCALLSLSLFAHLFGSSFFFVAPHLSPEHRRVEEERVDYSTVSIFIFKRTLRRGGGNRWVFMAVQTQWLNLMRIQSISNTVFGRYLKVAAQLIVCWVNYISCGN